MFIVQVHKNKLEILYDKSFIQNDSFKKKKKFRRGQRFSKHLSSCAVQQKGCDVNSFAHLNHFLRLWMNLPIWNQTRSPSSVLTRWFVTEISFFLPPFSTFLWMSSKGAILTAQSWAFRQSAALVFCASVCECVGAKNSYCADLQQGLVSIWAFFFRCLPTELRKVSGWMTKRKKFLPAHIFFAFVFLRLFNWLLRIVWNLFFFFQQLQVHPIRNQTGKDSGLYLAALRGS